MGKKNSDLQSIIQSVFVFLFLWRLKQTNTGLFKKNGCKCHISRTCINNKIKALRSDVKVEFSSSAKSVTSHTRFFEMDYQEVLQHIVTRGLSLLPAAERVEHSWPAPRSSFLSEGEEQCSKVLWKETPKGNLSCCTFYTQSGFFSEPRSLRKLKRLY